MELKVLALIVAAALNPLVPRTSEPHGIVPADCEVSDRAPVTRVAVADPAEEEAMPLPPVRPAATPAAKRAAGAEIKELQAALAKNDRAAFDAALERAKDAGAPTRVYEDIARVWNAQFESPFFAQDSEAYRVANGYPGYEAAVRRQVFTDARGRKFYPASETRAFLAQQVGVTAPAPSTRRASAGPSPSRRTPSSSTAITGRRSTTSGKTASKSSSPKSSTPKSSSSSSKPRMAAATRESAPPRSSPDPSAPARTAATEPAPVVPAPVEVSSTEAPPAAGTFEPAVTESESTATTLTATPAPEPVTPDTVASSEPAPTTTTLATPSRGRSIVLPAILILIGLGVLVLLFRTAR